MNSYEKYIDIYYDKNDVNIHSILTKCKNFYNHYYHIMKLLPDMRPISQSSFINDLDEWTDDKKIEYLHKELFNLFTLDSNDHLVCYDFFNMLSSFFNTKHTINIFNFYDINISIGDFQLVDRDNFVIQKNLSIFNKYNFLKTIRVFCIAYPSISYLMLLDKHWFPIAILGNHHCAMKMINTLEYNIDEYIVLSEDENFYNKIKWDDYSDDMLIHIIKKSIKMKNKKLFKYLCKKYKNNKKYKNIFISGAIIYDDFHIFVDIVAISKRIEYFYEAILSPSPNITTNLISSNYLNENIRKKIPFEQYLIDLLDKYIRIDSDTIHNDFNKIIKILIENTNINEYNYDNNYDMLIEKITKTKFNTIKLFLDGGFNMFTNISCYNMKISPLLLIINNKEMDSTKIHYLLEHYDVSIKQLIFDMIIVNKSNGIQLTIIMKDFLSKNEIYEINWILTPMFTDIGYNTFPLKLVYDKK